MSGVEDLLNLIKEYWPKFIISKENLLKPTQELVVRFYNNFIDDYNEKVAYLTGVPAASDFNAVDYEPEEKLFQQLSRLLEKIDGLKFSLSDIYQPTPIRTKNFFKICIHFVAFTEYFETDALGHNVFKTKQDMSNILLEQEALMYEINENAKNKAEISENRNLVEQDYNSTKNAYEEMKPLKAIKEKLCIEKNNRIENLERELHNGEYELKRLENIEKDLLEQKITDREHQNILQSLETLKSESEILDSDDNDIGDGLVHENKVLQHIADCTRILDKCDFNVENVKKLIYKEDELKVILNAVDKLRKTRLNPIKQQKLESERKLITEKEQLINLQNEHKFIKNSYTSSLTEFSQELNNFKDGLQGESEINNKIIVDCKKDIKRLGQDLEKLKNAFTTEYVKVSNIEKTVVDKFKETLMKFKEME